MGWGSAAVGRPPCAHHSAPSLEAPAPSGRQLRDQGLRGPGSGGVSGRGLTVRRGWMWPRSPSVGAGGRAARPAGTGSGRGRRVSAHGSDTCKRRGPRL